MKKIFCLSILFALFYVGVSYSATVDRYPVVVTTDASNFTTSVNKFWRWLETRIHFSSNVQSNIFHIIDSAEGSNHDVIIKHSFITATQDITIYPGATDDTAVVFLRDTDELKVYIQNTNTQPYITIVGEEI